MTITVYTMHLIDRCSPSPFKPHSPPPLAHATECVDPVRADSTGSAVRSGVARGGVPLPQPRPRPIGQLLPGRHPTTPGVDGQTARWWCGAAVRNIAPSQSRTQGSPARPAAQPDCRASGCGAPHAELLHSETVRSDLSGRCLCVCVII